MKKDNPFGISPDGWRYIGYALAILSLGLAIAWGGFVFFSNK